MTFSFFHVTPNNGRKSQSRFCLCQSFRFFPFLLSYSHLACVIFVALYTCINGYKGNPWSWLTTRICVMMPYLDRALYDGNFHHPMDFQVLFSCLFYPEKKKLLWSSHVKRFSPQSPSSSSYSYHIIVVVVVIIEANDDVIWYHNNIIIFVSLSFNFSFHPNKNKNLVLVPAERMSDREESLVGHFFDYFLLLLTFLFFSFFWCVNKIKFFPLDSLFCFTLLAAAVAAVWQFCLLYAKLERLEKWNVEWMKERKSIKVFFPSRSKKNNNNRLEKWRKLLLGIFEVRAKQSFLFFIIK